MAFQIKTWCSGKKRLKLVVFESFESAFQYATKNEIDVYHIRPVDNAVKICGASNAGLKRLEKAGISYDVDRPASFAQITRNAVQVRKEDESEAVQLIGRRARVDGYGVHPLIRRSA